MSLNGTKQNSHIKHFTRQLDIVIIAVQYCQEEQRYDVEKCLREFLTTTLAILATRIVIIINYGNIYLVDIPANQFLISVKIVTRKQHSLSYFIPHSSCNYHLYSFCQVLFDFGTPSLNTL